MSFSIETIENQLVDFHYPRASQTSESETNTEMHAVPPFQSLVASSLDFEILLCYKLEEKN